MRILAETAKLFRIPTVLSTVAKDSFSGACLPEVAEDVFPNQAPLDRTSINAWLDPRFRAAVRATGRKRMILAGLWTSACVNFPTLDMLNDGFEIFVTADACGDTSREAHGRAIQRMIQAGAVPATALQLVFELQQDWAQSATYHGVMEILEARTGDPHARGAL